MPGMRYETKTAILIHSDLARWQIANVAGFLAGGLAGFFPEIVGEPYRDATGRIYTPLVREPLFVYAATTAELVIESFRREPSERALGLSWLTTSR